MKNNIQIGLWMLLLTAIAIIAYNVIIKMKTTASRSTIHAISSWNYIRTKYVKVHLKGGAIKGEDVYWVVLSAPMP